MFKKKFSFFKFLAVFTLIMTALFVGMHNYTEKTVTTISQVGSRGKEVVEIQKLLKQYGLFDSEVTGYYGPITEKAVKRFQKANGISQTGIAGPQTLAKMGITIGSIPAATQANINLLARIISAEGRGEVYEGQVAIGACILNRIEHPSFPDTLSGVIFQPGAFTAVTDGQFNQPVADSCYRAARDALNGWDPTGGAIYYYNPAKTQQAWIVRRPVIKRIGNHLFCS